MTNTKIERAVKKVQIAIDKLIDLQGMGFDSSEIDRALEILRNLEYDIEETLV
ncbi:MAG: hypothetical protein JKY33_10520 [Bacteroidia bacterium]|nr:hypothetical protein [Bacteroidia bacterium]